VYGQRHQPMHYSQSSRLRHMGPVGRYTGFRNTTLRLGIKNILNRDPPLSNQIAALQVGYDPTYADPRGRTFYGSVRYAFK
jgi:iron complex outermembrane recepter protein